jgi:molybdenum cofactor biosynthesis enzyme MoaA
VSLYSVSVDAASKAVYEDVRRPGRWDIIMHNLSWLSANRGNSQVTLNFTVQANNYKDIPNFANLAKSLGFVASFSALEDWGTWNTDVTVRPDTWTIKNGFFKDHDVVDCSHPQHQDLLHVLKELDLLDPNLGLNPRLKNLL